MKTYLVGGAVRDALLGITAEDRDWLVVGESPASMLAAGFRPVGADFPVFLHPQTGEEYALARTERKSAPGYKGFIFHADPNVRLEQDLARRDFRINAIAQDIDGHLIDPFDGQRDLQQRLLRHVSPAFAEDPLRILRAARFMARFAHLGFTVAPETMALMRDMVADGDITHLVPERIWQEVRAALSSQTPSAFLKTLRACGALAIILPELDALYGIPQHTDAPPEIDTGTHVEIACDRAAQQAPGDALIGFATLLQGLGTTAAPTVLQPHPLPQATSRCAQVQAVCTRWKVPGEYAAMATHACGEHRHIRQLRELTPSAIHDLLIRIDSFRRPERVAQLVQICEADRQGHLGMATVTASDPHLLQYYFAAASAVKASHLAGGLNGPAVGSALRNARIAAIASAKEG